MANRKTMVAEMQSLLSLVTQEGRAFTIDEQARFDSLKANVERIDDLDELGAPVPAQPTNPTRQIAAPALHLAQRANHGDLLRGAIALAVGERGIDTGLAAEFDKEVRRRNPAKKFASVAMSLKSLLVTKASDIGALSGGLAVDTTGTQFMDSLFYRTGDAIFGPQLASQLGVNTILASEEKVHVTKLVGTVTPSWIARDGDVPKSDAEFDADEIEPKSIGTQITLKRSALLYGNHPSVQPLMLQDLRDAMLAEFDRATLFGEGGLAPVGVVGLATAGHALATLADAYSIRNALFAYTKSANLDGAKWLLPDLVEGKFATTAGFTGSTAPALVQGGTLAGCEYVLNPASGAGSPTPSAEYLFGQWNYVHLVLWDAVSILANPYGSQFASGGIDLRVLADANVYVRDPSRLFVGSASALSA